MTIDQKVNLVLQELRKDSDFPPQLAPVIDIVLREIFSISESVKRIADALDHKP